MNNIKNNELKGLILKWVRNQDFTGTNKSPALPCMLARTQGKSRNSLSVFYSNRGTKLETG